MHLWIIHFQKLSSLNLKLFIFNAIERNKDECFSVDFRKNDQVQKRSGALEIDWHVVRTSFQQYIQLNSADNMQQEAEKHDQIDFYGRKTLPSYSFDASTF